MHGFAVNLVLGQRRPPDVSFGYAFANLIFSLIHPIRASILATLQEGFCHQKDRHRKTDSKNRAGRVAKSPGNPMKTTKNPENPEKLRGPLSGSLEGVNSEFRIATKWL